MITPGIHRRALARAAQWRLLVLWWVSLLVPGFLAAVPVFRFLSFQLDRLPRANEVVASLDGSTAIELLRQLGQEGNAARIWSGALSGLAILLLVSPFVAGAMVAAARSDETLRFPRLLGCAGELYGRMWRVLIVAAAPLGLAAMLGGGILAGVRRVNERALWETQILRRQRLALAAAALLLFLAHLLVDLMRAHFAADASRRSALASLWRALGLFVRRPLRVVAIGGMGALAGIAPALVLTALRVRIPQRTAVAMALAWLLAQAAQVAIGWGRGARIFGLTELVRADALDQAHAAFAMAPPATSPPAAVEPQPPAEGGEQPLPRSDPEREPPLSPTGGSGT